MSGHFSASAGRASHFTLTVSRASECRLTCLGQPARSAQSPPRPPQHQPGCVFSCSCSGTPALLIHTCSLSLPSSQGCLLAAETPGLLSITAPARLPELQNSRSPHPTPTQTQMGCNLSLLLVSWDPGALTAPPPEVSFPTAALPNPLSLFVKGHKTIPCDVLSRAPCARLHPCSPCGWAPRSCPSRRPRCSSGPS